MISLRRKQLNQLIKQNLSFITGKVLDVGGKIFTKDIINKKKISYFSLNNDKKTNPTFLTDASKIPVKKNFFDTVLMYEVLEYLDNYDLVFKEIFRVMKKNSYFIFSSPFLFPIHYDYSKDLLRFTRKKLLKICKENNFKLIKIVEMGSIGSCLYDILRINFTYASKNKNFIAIFILRALLPIFELIDYFNKDKKKFINSGYFVVLKKQ